MLLLALDTSTSYASIALARDGRLIAELTWEVGQRHSAELFDRIAQLLDGAHLAPDMLNGIAVALGPGSFNGTRVAVTAAKTLAFALGVPLYGHSTLDVIAWPYASSGSLTIWSLLDAGRGQVYAARYMHVSPSRSKLLKPPPPNTTLARSPAAQWKAAEAPAIMTPTELAEHIDATWVMPVVFAGEWRPETREVLEHRPRGVSWFVPELGGRRASSLAELAFARAEKGDADDPLTLEPLYLRKPNITQSAKVALPPYSEPTTPPAGGEDTAHALHR
jgi:tRNA threonylcarbamoyladenosine biosynthesis protein TsaB